MAYLNYKQIRSMGFASVGTNVYISDKASIYGSDRIAIGNNVRIDDFVVLSAGVGGIYIGNYVHIAVYTSLIGAGSIRLEDFCNLSSRVSIYSSNDDYSGLWMTNPTVPSIYTNVTHDNVLLKKHVIVGSGSVVLPGVVLNEGVAIGALSLVSRSCEAFGVYCGNPLRLIKDRNRNILDIEKNLHNES